MKRLRRIGREWKRRQDHGGVFFGWWIVAAVMGVQFLLAGLLVQAYGTYAAAWRDTFGWSSTAIAAAYAAHRVQRGVVAPLLGLILQRFGARSTMRVGMVLFGVGLVALSRTESLAFFFAAFLVASFGTSLTGALSLSTVLVNWFERRRATALALMNTGKSFGGLAVPLIAWAIGTLGWRSTLLASGVIALTGGLLLTQVMRTTPEQFGLAPDGDRPKRQGNDPERQGNDPERQGDDPERQGDQPERTGESRNEGSRDESLEDSSQPSSEPAGRSDPSGGNAFSTRQALRTRAFWLLSAGHALAVAVVSAVVVHLVVYLNEELGYSLPTAATFFALMTGFSIAGQLVGGPIGDRVEKRKLAAIAALGHAAAVLLLATTRSTLGIVGFAALHGLAWGTRAPLMGALRADYFGREKYATIMGVSSSIVMLGSIAGPFVLGLAADAGSYPLGFAALAGTGAAASLCFFLARLPHPSS